jgi:hypothetical protein
MDKRLALKTRMIAYFVLCVAFAFGSPLWARVLGIGSGSLHAWFMAACCLSAIVLLWAALRQMQCLQLNADTTLRRLSFPPLFVDNR